MAKYITFALVDFISYQYSGSVNIVLSFLPEQILNNHVPTFWKKYVLNERYINVHSELGKSIDDFMI